MSRIGCYRRVSSVILLVFAAAFLPAQDEGAPESPDASAGDFFADPFAVSGEEENATDNPDDFDSLFEGEMLDFAEQTGDGVSPEEELLSAEGPAVTWGGRISGSLAAELTWGNLWTDELDPRDPDDQTLTPSVTSDLFFDARPDPDFRAFGKLRISTDTGTGGLAETVNTAALTADLPEGWTREETPEGDTIIRDTDGEEVFTVTAEDEEDEEPQTGTPPGISIDVVELFSDFNFDKRFFFRFGKHTIKWGVGYFWSPADVLNLTAIDVEDPTAEREGPVSLKAHYPFGLNNLYLYLITNAQAKPLEVAVAPKFEFVIGTTEISLAAYYQQALAPRGVVTLSSSIGDVDFFGEGVVTLGSDRVFVRESRRPVSSFEDPPEELEVVLDTYVVDSIPFFSATAGARYLKELEQGELKRAPGSLAVVGQYYYNGEGYPDSRLLKPAAFLQQNPEYNGLALPEEAQSEEYESPPDLSFGDLSSWGRHYAALTAAWNNIFESDVSISLFNLTNLNDLSGIISPSVSFTFIDVFTVSAGVRMTYGNKNDEYTNPASLFGLAGDSDGATAAFTLSVSMGRGSF